MKEQASEIGKLEEKYKEEIAVLERNLEEARRLLNAVIEVKGLLMREGVFDQEILFPKQQSSKYSKTKMGDAIIDIVKSEQGKRVGSEFILLSLQNNGFVSESKNLKRDVFTRLHRLEKRGILTSKREGGLKRYALKEDVGNLQEDLK
jgi:hypothetical protein